ncbi:MAG: glycerol-3-phosphate 1-O-acyltransferase PlsY [Oscillatoriaceae bacterium SKW80]|nr:glycerol-3-phosphate 1-O-acyltransferase PlsY [Oscillatoriaceae bacterium SKYG93]MCX8121653.1 glycerol-3-phosphate 1-O-acyltransferase PlsY [Oscillatoriaceae bacterium SKW80]MDW8453961.1 glycerol-3-phosphate 1-O-acyltransferase PlsY [Oscillatoriaceae cyanobacterium SKYGB_i_bin93]HIK28794.1 glycerol-3-phosphate 1-O-acyltransferase PlsY [Oscillatoriaceae cyanobacterium M7585_C2015_266]
MVLWLGLNLGLLLLAYLLGSLPTGYVITRRLKGIDIREVGSGSTGATNVLRTLGKGPALVVLAIDVLKGVAAITIVRWAYFLEITSTLAAPPILENWLPWMVTGAGLLAVLGHSKSVWLGFTGGKSVATSLGILLALYWPVGLATLGIFAIVLAISRIVSLSSIIGALACSGLMLLAHQPLPYCLFAVFGGLYVIARHRSNIERLLAGNEPRIGEKISQEPEVSS